ncbi:hypothetical protein BG011_007316, partial [Mortierella polycephala]
VVTSPSVFYDRNGAGRGLKVWDGKLQGGRWEEDFVNSAVDVVVNRTLKHLERNEYAEGAKYLTRFLKGLLREDVSDQELPSKSPKRQKGLRSLTEDAQRRVKDVVTKHDWYIVYDNINAANKHHHQRADKRDTFDNGTAATLILFPSDKDQSPAAPPALFRPEDERPELIDGLFFPKSIDMEVFQQVTLSHVSAAIVRSLPKGSTAVAIPILPIKKLDVHKTALFPLQTMKLDESTIAGNLAVLERITQIGLQLPEKWLVNPKDTIVAGDQMTVSRLLTLKIHRIVDTDPYHSLAWVHPTL